MPLSFRVLVVDDNSDAADVLAELLKFNGLEVAVAYGGEQAIAIAEAFRPDVVFLDIGMPVLDGYQTARALREKLSTSVYIVALTAWNDAATLTRVAQAGFDRHLTKPANLDAILTIIAVRAAAGVT